MIDADAITKRLRRGRDGVRATIAGHSRTPGWQHAPVAAPDTTSDAVGPSELLQRRDDLARRLAELQWDLGGLAYEMAIRDHFRVEVLVRVAARLQAVDGELAEIERLLHLGQAGAAGACPNCGALHARGAGFCWQCGEALLAVQPASSA